MGALARKAAWHQTNDGRYCGIARDSLVIATDHEAPDLEGFRIDPPGQHRFSRVWVLSRGGLLMRVFAIGLAIAVIVFVVTAGHVLFLPLLFLPLGLFSFGHNQRRETNRRDEVTP
jgi:hypothetical protein